MSVSSNLFNSDSLDVPVPIEQTMYSGAIRLRKETDENIIDEGNTAKKALSILYLFLVTGEDKYVKLISLLGSSQETIFVGLVEVLSIGQKLKNEVLRNLTKYIASFFPHIIRNAQLVLQLIKSIAQYSALASGDEEQCQIALSIVTQIISQVTETHSDDPYFLSQVTFVIGRLVVDYHSIAPKNIDLFASLINRIAAVQHQDNGRELIRTCLELCGIYDFSKFLTSDSAYTMMSATSNSHHLQLRIPSWLWSNVTFILDNINESDSQDYLKMLNLESLSEEFRVDLIRALVCCYHPPNRILASGNIQRWSLIFTILKGFKSPSSVASAKLAIYLDWLIPTADLKRNVMLFEPGCLLICRSSNEMVKLSLLEFLSLCSKQFNPSSPSKDHIAAVFRTLVELGVMKWKDISISKSSPNSLLEFLNDMQTLGHVETRKSSKDASSLASSTSIDAKEYLKRMTVELEQLKRTFLMNRKAS